MLIASHALPAGAQQRPAEDGRLVLRRGEATGHAHVVEAPAGEAELYEAPDGTLWLSVASPVAVRHEEHAAGIVQPGFYRVGAVREADPFADAIHAVHD